MPTPIVASKFETDKVYTKCRVTIVSPGSSDKVIDIYPAEIDKEKIWLDNTAQIERWEAIQRLMDNQAERGTRVSKPAPYHSSVKDLKTIDLDEKDIPLVRLVDVVLKAPPIPEKAPAMPNPIQAQQQIMDDQKQQAANTMALAQAVANLTTLVMNNKQSNGATQEAHACADCSKVFDSEHGLKIHGKKAHKE